MSQPLHLPGAVPGRAFRPSRCWLGHASVAVAAAVIAGTALLGLAAGYLWAAVAPRALLVLSGHGMTALAAAEPSAFIAADAAFCLICLAGGVVSGLLGYLLAVRRHGPLGMAGVLLGGLAAALVARWIGEQSGLAAFHHLLATLPAGSRLRAPLRLRAASVLGAWPLAGGLTAGGIEWVVSRPRNGSGPPPGPFRADDG
jgi:hypothetical protein